MASKNDKWVMFRNYMHNELGITKDDIREWIKDVIRDEVKNVVAQAYGRCSIDDMIRHVIESHDYYGRRCGFEQDVINATARILSERLEITAKK